MSVVNEIQELREKLDAKRAPGKLVGLVPTMGALHEGHLSLVRTAKQECDYVVATIFVNPKQFDASEDLERYPRDQVADCNTLQALGVDLIFIPSADEVFPAGFSTMIEPPSIAKRLEGECRPGHFRGVATVVLKLFQIAPCDVAFFGRKDYQQALVIQRMACDLNLPIEIRFCPTVRDPDGLALSSRNYLLNAEQRAQAQGLVQSLDCAQQLVSQGERDSVKIKEEMQRILAARGISKIDYISIAHAETLEEVNHVREPVVVLIAAYVGQTRLIDNQQLILS
ncbi:MAG: pantoate--beta-alanine ligase [Planctomycetaceae bacterium]|nr:pantoate--beta-alanine ligase [Planctomycetaceae bacterium]